MGFLNIIVIPLMALLLVCKLSEARNEDIRHITKLISQNPHSLQREKRAVTRLSNRELPPENRRRTTKKRRKPTTKRTKHAQERTPPQHNNRRKEENGKAKNWNRFTRVTPRITWVKGAHPDLRRPNGLAQCILRKRCTKNSDCAIQKSRTNRPCKYCNTISKLCTIYRKSGLNHQCQYDRQCNRNAICTKKSSKNALLAEEQNPSIRSGDQGHNNDAFEEEEEQQQTSGSVCQLQRGIPVQIDYKKNKNAAWAKQKFIQKQKWPEPSTYLKSDTIKRLQKKFTEAGGSTLVLVTEGVINDFKLDPLQGTKTIESILKSGRTRGVPIVPTAEMDRMYPSGSPIRGHEMLQKLKKIAYVTPSIRDTPEGWRDNAIVRVDIRPGDLNGWRLLSGNEDYLGRKPEDFLPGGHTQGETGIPEALVFMPNAMGRVDIKALDVNMSNK